MSQLYTRTVSSFPLSIGTSLALESLFTGPQPTYDPDRKPPPKIDLAGYNSIYLNVATLLRNISHSVQREVYFEASVAHVTEILKSEIDLIRNVFQIEGGGVCVPFFYICSYRSFKNDNAPEVKFREATTPFQQHYDFKQQEVLKRISREVEQVQEFDSEVRPQRRDKSLILTHLPIDLLSYKRFEKLDLLESHTGLLKTKREWDTKYVPVSNKSMSHLPWNKKLLCVFGDRQQIQPQDRKLRDLVYDISVKDAWTPFTTEEKINTAFRRYVLEPFVQMWLLKL